MKALLAGAIACAIASAACAAPNYTTSVTIGYDPAAATSNFGSPGTTNSETAYTVRTGIDSSNFYVDVTANPTNGTTPDQFANIYLGGPSSSQGFIIEVTNNRAILTGVNGAPYYSLSGTGYTYSASLNDISFAIPLTFLENDPLGIGFTKYNTGDTVRVSYSQSFGYSFVGGGTNYPSVNRLGGQVIPFAASAAPEPASWAMMIAGFGAIGATLRRRARTTVRFA